MHHDDKTSSDDQDCLYRSLVCHVPGTALAALQGSMLPVLPRPTRQGPGYFSILQMRALNPGGGKTRHTAPE